MARSLHRVLLAVGACALVLNSASAADAQDGQPVAPPQFGVLQFADDEVYIDLPVGLADAWKQTLEVVASLNDSVQADLPYLESNGRIVAGKLWIAVEAQGAPGTNWVRIRVAIPADEPEYGKVRAEIILDAIADRFEPPPAAPQEQAYNYPQMPASVEGAGDQYVTNNYYYGSGPYTDSYNQSYPAYSYVPVYSAPYWYGPLYAPYVYYPSYCWSPCYWNTGWWFGWGGPWCNPWGSSFSLCWGSGWHWSFSACFGSFCGWWGNGCGWGCNPWWSGCGSWDTCSWNDSFDSSTNQVVALAPRTSGQLRLSGGDFLGNTPADRVPHVTDRVARRAPDSTAPVVVTRTERGPRPGHAVLTGDGQRPWSEQPARLPDGPRPRVVVSTSSGSTRTGTSSNREGPVVVRMGSVPYNSRVNPVALDQRAPTSTLPLSNAPLPNGSTAPGASDRATIDNHPYINPFPTTSSAGNSSGGARPSSPAPSASAPRSSAPAPASMPSRTSSAPSRPSSAPSSGGHSSGGSFGGGHSSGGSFGGSSGGSRGGGGGGGRGPR
ncbi:MAG TPA: hypothetical protein VFY71_01340 [Planctomycetota bacterium]|nr:hypothetical protein [Planctomycetota bacterium]